MGESSDPEEVASVMNHIKTEAVRIVEGHGGIVNQFVGDEVVAVFGMPTARGDDARRATAAALELHEVVRELAPRVTADGGLRMHTGIQSGLIVAEPRDRRDGMYAISGDTINTAARLLALAGPDEIFIGEGTLSQVRDYFETRSTGVHAVKGKAEGLPAHLVLGPRTGTTRSHPVRDELTPLTGRTRELAVLNDTLDQALAGRGLLVAVEGDAGVGKTRLCHEFLAAIDHRRAAVYIGRCQSYGSVVPYLPFVDAFRAGLGFDGTEPVDTVVEHTVRAVRDIHPRLERYIPVYLQLLSAPSPTYPLPPGITVDEMAQLIPDGVVALNLALAERRPVVLLLEDWHWADEASRSTLASLVGRIAGHPMLIITARRPGQVEHWNVAPAGTVVLEPFGLEDTGDIVARCLGVGVVDPTLRARVYERTQGNPFFVEEVCRSLVQDGRVRREVGARLLVDDSAGDYVLPGTVQAVLLGRVDGLRPELRDLLRLASVIGQDFSRAILDRLVPAHRSTEPMLLELEALGFVVRLPQGEVGDYRFKHVTTQEVTYGTLLRAERARAHERVAAIVESLDQGDQQVEAIARHYRAAGAHARALGFFERAARKATRTSALEEARQHLYEAVQCSVALGDDETTVRTRVRLVLRWAQACIYNASTDQIELVERARREAETLRDRALVLQCLYWISWIYHSVGEHVLAQDAIERALAESPGAEPDGTTGLMRLHLGYCLASQGKPGAGDVLRQGIAERERARRLSGQAPNDGDAYGLTILGLVHAGAGEFAAADELTTQGLDLARATGRRHAEGSILLTQGLVHLLRTDWEGVLATVEPSRVIGVQVRAPYIVITADIMSGYARYRRGEHAPGLDAMARGLEDLERSGAFMSKCMSLGCMADALSRSGRFAEAEPLAAAALGRAAGGDTLGDELAHRALLRIDAQRSPAAVAQDLARFRGDAEARDNRRRLAIAQLAEAETSWLLGRKEDAVAAALIARDGARDLGMRGNLGEANALLATLLAADP
jgi:class 3 adenylate cyclase/tetratricopeptide (TPR) repeat protein